MQKGHVHCGELEDPGRSQGLELAESCVSVAQEAEGSTLEW